ncbi:MAG: response regulator, partial [Sulfurimonas sp.]|nr:response regulator [Sulfurimonas sp.]
DSTVVKPDVNIIKKEIDSVDFAKFFGLDILIVDDILENIHIMENIFNTLSCNIKSAMSGEEALEIFKDGYLPDIICMDMVMPGIDGSTTTKELKALGCKAYFIAISALKNQPNSIISLFDCWLPKPFTQDHIIGALVGYKMSNNKDVIVNDYKLSSDISSKQQNEILHLAKRGAYSELDRLISELEDSESKEFLNTSLKNVDFSSIIKSIVSS